MHIVNAKGILSAKNGMNIYRGCTHGCIYCDARSSCYQMDHRFEDVQVKGNAAELLEDALRRRRRRGMIFTGAMCDPYWHGELQLGLTRRCLEVIDRYRFGLVIHTKSDRILRDLDLLESIHRKSKCVVQFTLTTWDPALCRTVEPNVCDTQARHGALQTLHARGIPTVVWLSPVLPFINDTAENISQIVAACAQAGVYGVVCFGMGVTLRAGDREYFYKALDRHFPGLKQRYIRTYGLRYELPSPHNDTLMQLFYKQCRASGMVCDHNEVFAFLNNYTDRQEQAQIKFF